MDDILTDAAEIMGVDSEETELIGETSQEGLAQNDRNGPLKVQVALISDSGERSGVQLIEGERNPFQCVVCDKIFKKRSALTAHIKSHGGSIKEKDTSVAPGGLFECKTCGRFIKNKGAFHTHIKSHYRSIKPKNASDKPDDWFDCKTCGRSFWNKGAFLSHLKVHKRTVRSQSDTMGDAQGNDTTKSPRVIGKESTHTGIDEERTLSKNQFQLQVKVISDSGERSGVQIFDEDRTPLKCSICDRIFKNKSALTTHRKSHDGSIKLKDTSDEPGGWFDCKICGRSMKNKGAFHTHLKMHKNNLQSQSYKMGGAQDDNNSNIPHNHNLDEKFTDTCIDEENTLSSNQCPVCDVVVVSDAAFMEHLQSHQGDKPKERGIMHDRRLSTSAVQTNSTSLEQQEQFICSICERIFESRGSLLLHEQTHEGEKKRFKCLFCHQVYANTKALQLHLKCHKSKCVSGNPAQLSHKCFLCNRHFKMREHLLNHMKNRHRREYSKGRKMVNSGKIEVKKGEVSLTKKENPLECNLCLKTFPDGGSLVQHQEEFHSSSTSNDENLMQKTLTKNKEFDTLENSSSSYDDHSENHMEDDNPNYESVDPPKHDIGTTLENQAPHKCHACNQHFKYKVTYRNHVLSCCPGLSKKVHDCRVCNTPFTSLDEFNRHIVSHCEGDNYSLKCPVCYKDFSSKPSLQRHVQFHIKKSYRCQVCGLIMRCEVSTEGAKSRNKGHHLICSGCRKSSYKRRSCLTKKMKERRQKAIYLEENSTLSVCKICNKIFASINSLNCHMRIHKGENCYQCDFCDKSFNRKRFFKSHLKFCHKKVLVTCKKGLERKISGNISTDPGVHEENTLSSSQSQLQATLLPDSGERSKEQQFDEERNPLKCLICDRIFKNRSALTTHRKSHDGSIKLKDTSDEPGGWFDCKVCGRSMKNKGAFHTHLKSHKPNAPSQNDSGDNTKMTVSDAEEDDNEKSPGIVSKESTDICIDEENTLLSIQCPLCDVVVRSDAAFIEHLQSHQDDNPQEKGIMKDRNLSEKPKNSVQKNTRVLRKHEQFICSICERIFESRGGLLLHEQTHEGEKKRFKCLFCQQVYANIKALQLHLKCHKSKSAALNPAELSYKCTLCNQRFQMKAYLLKHMKNHHVGERFKGNETVISGKMEVKKGEVSLTTEKTPLECNLCLKTFPDGGSLVRHQEEFHSSFTSNDENLMQKTLVKNEELDTLGISSSSYDDHTENLMEDDNPNYESVDPPKHDIGTTLKNQVPHKCHECNQHFKCKVAYRNHVLSCCPGLSKKVHDCRVCNTPFTSLDEFNRHIVSHCEGDNYSLKCPVCYKDFSSKLSLQRHVQFHIRKFSRCQVCGLTMRCGVSTDGAESGSKGHNLICSACRKSSVKKRSSLTKKLKVKVNVKKRRQKVLHLVENSTSSVCKICNKVFASLNSLNCHMTIHKGEKFQCDFCDKSFSRKFILKSHLKIIHKKVSVNSKKGLEREVIRLNLSNQVLYKCPVCSLVFIHRNEIEVHMRIHTGQKPYECSICAETFNARYQWQEHLKTLHPLPSRPDMSLLGHKCFLCGRAFKKKFDLKKHLKVHVKHGHISMSDVPNFPREVSRSRK